MYDDEKEEIFDEAREILREKLTEKNVNDLADHITGNIVKYDPPPFNGLILAALCATIVKMARQETGQLTRDYIISTAINYIVNFAAENGILPKLPVRKENEEGETLQ